MTHPLAEFGLDEDADERAVKRAYAKRLKVTRPDEDAGAFQALNEAYQRALGFIRWRDAQAQEEDETEFLDEVEAPLPTERPVFHGPMVFDAPVAPVVPQAEERLRFPEAPADEEERPDPFAEAEAPDELLADTLFQQETVPHRTWPEKKADTPPQPFTFSIDDFMEGMVTQGLGRDPGRLRQWLRVEMASWPLTARPQIAHAVINHVFENDFVIRPDVFDTLVDELGLNDIRITFVDPMAIAQYREKMAYRFDVAVDVIPERSWHKWVTLGLFGIFVFLVLGGLMFGDKDMAQSGRSPMVSERPWYRSVNDNVYQPMALQSLSDADNRTLSLVAAAAKQKDAQFIIAMLEKAAAPAPMDLAKRRVLAAALYGFGQDLQQTDKPRSYEAYRELQSRFQAEKDHDIALLVVGSYINIGYGELTSENFDAALAAFRAVQSQYGYITEGRIGLQVFNAMFGEARVLHSQQNVRAASEKLKEITALFALSADMLLRRTVEKPVREFRRTLSLQPNPT